MLHLRKAFPAFRACYGTPIFSTFQNGKLKANQGFQCLPFSTTSGDHSDQQPPRFEISAQLPDILQQQCANWMKASWAEQKAKEAKEKWCNLSLKCTNISPIFNSSELTMSMEELTKERKRVFLSYITRGTPVLVRPFVKCPWQEDIVGILRKHLFDSNGQLHESIVYVKRQFSRDEQERIKNTLFDVKRAPPPIYDDFIEWLKRNNEWVRMPGYDAMLYSFKCKPWPAAQEIGPDPSSSIAEKEKNSLDQSQLAALCAVQNLNRPIVAVHGPPGTGKTMLLVRHLQQLKKQGKDAFVLSASLPALYNLIDNYHQTTKDANYLILKTFNKQLADRVVSDLNIRQNIEKRSEFYKILDAMRSVKGGIIFATPSPAIIKEFTRNRIIFDVLIVEEANAMNEFETWWTALPLASIIRLFGSVDGQESPTSSEEAVKLGHQQSLLKRMDQEFGTEVNFHLQHQYRSAAAIQEWPARAFYGRRAAEADNTVENIHLNDLLIPDAKMITDPLVLVDLNRLEGEWSRTMFEPELGGDSFYNFGEALLVAQHLRKLFENLQKCDPTQIAYFTRYEAQYVEIRQIFQCFFSTQFKNLEKVRFDQIEMEGKACEVVLQSFVTADRARTLLSTPHHLKRLAFGMTRARRQYMLFARSEWLEEGSDESRQLLDTFRSHGRIIGPNDLLKLKHHTQIFDTKLQIDKMVHQRNLAERRKKSPNHYK